MNPQKPLASVDQAWPMVAVGLGAAFIGLAPIGVRESELGPQATAAWRFGIAAVVLAAAWLVMRNRPGAPATRFGGRFKLLAVAGVCLGIDIGLWHESLHLTTVANATLLSNMTPVIAVLVGWLVFKERVGWGFAAGAGIALTGAVLLTLGRLSTDPTARASHLWGDALALATAVFYAGYLILLSRARQQAEVIAAMLITTIAAFLVTLVLTLVKGEAVWPTTAYGWAVLVGLGTVVHVGGQGLIALGLGRLPITLSTVLLWIQPVAAAMLGWALYQEALGPVALAGAAMVLCGIWVVQRSRAR
jgi:drug/metabolite transporter (DMT)-like permease